jgi:putative flippase GtrA
VGGWRCALEDLVGMEREQPEALPGSAHRRRLWDLASPALISEPVRFGASGIAATHFYFLVVNLLIYGAGLAAVLSSNLAYLMALGVSYLLQSRYTFRVNSDSFGQVVKYLLTAVAGIGISSGVMYLVVHIMEWPALVASLIVCILIPVSNYLMFKFWVFATHA